MGVEAEGQDELDELLKKVGVLQQSSDGNCVVASRKNTIVSRHLDV